MECLGAGTLARLRGSSIRSSGNWNIEMFWRALRPSHGRKTRKSSRSHSAHRRFMAAIEPLESRRVLTAMFNNTTGVLTVNGTDSNDTITVSLTKTSLGIQATINGQVQSITQTMGPTVSSIPVAFVNEVDVNSMLGIDVVTLNSIDKTVDVTNGGSSNNRLVIVGHAGQNAFTLPTTNADTNILVNGNTYTYDATKLAFLGLYGQSAADKLTVETVPTLMGTNPEVLFDGGAGSDKIVGPDTDNTWNIVLANGGNLMPTGQPALTFGNTESLTGGSGVDTFNFGPRGSLAANADGGDGFNSADFSQYTKPTTFVMRSGTTTGLVGYGTGVGSLSNVISLTGGSANDTLVGSSGVNSWDISGQNAGVLDGLNFASFENLVGGAKPDTFIFNDASIITGVVNGGGGTDTIDFGSYTTNVNVNLASKTFAGVNTGGFTNVESFVGAGGSMATSTVIGPNVNSTWNISTIASVNHASIAGIDFAGFQNLTGGTKNDTFLFTDGGAVSGKIDGGAGTNTLNYSKYTTDVTVDLKANPSTGAGRGIANIQSLIGSAGTNDTLIGTNDGDTFNITGKNAGNVTIGSATIPTITFTGIENLSGGTGADLFEMFSGTNIALTGKIDGVANTSATAFDEIDYSRYTTGVTVDLSGQDSASMTGTATNVGGGVSHIADIFGGSGIDMLTGDSKDNFIFGNGGNDVIDGLGGNNVLVGGAGNDKLSVTGSVGRNILIGGLGSDTLTGAAPVSPSPPAGQDGQDILINGTTSFDTNAASLNSIYMFWIATTSDFATRVAQLKAGFTPAGSTTSIALNSTTVFDDTSVDTLNGNGGSNWFLAKTTMPNKDVIPVLSADDILN